MLTAAEKYEACVDELARFVCDAGFAEVVIGLSGGIDSALVATMAVDALGSDAVHGVLLPGPYSSEHSVSDALELAEDLAIKTCTIPITAPYEAFASGFAEAMGEALSGLAAENTQARCRMIFIMALSNAYGWMMLNTGNKSEAAMGYSTLYGDTAGAFAPIGGLYKSDVYALARWRNEQAAAQGQAPPIPEHIITKPPSAELSPDQEDEASLGITYEVLDALLIAHVEQGLGLEDLVAQGFDRDQAAMVIERYASYGFKRALEPPSAGEGFYADTLISSTS